MRKTDPITTLLAHANLTLPDSIGERLKLLRAMREMMTTLHPAWRDVNQQIEILHQATHCQAAAQLKFATLLRSDL